MKKILSIISLFVLTLSMSTIVLAAPAPKTAIVSLSTTSTTIEVGQTATLTASSLKQGSSYTDSWNGAVKNNTILDEATGNYVSTATFSASKPGTYTVTYAVTMGAGKSGVTFIGTQSTTITVISPAKIVGVVVKNVSTTPNYNESDKNPNLTGYDATGDVYAVWSNGSETPYGTTTFKFSPNQVSRNIDVEVGGTTYTVSVKR
jgi:hypothetical protein